MIIISHDPEKAMQYATHILHLGRRMLYFGATEGYDREAVLAREREV